MISMLSNDDHASYEIYITRIESRESLLYYQQRGYQTSELKQQTKHIFNHGWKIRFALKITIIEEVPLLECIMGVVLREF